MITVDFLSDSGMYFGDSLCQTLDSCLAENKFATITANELLPKNAINKLQFTNRIFIESPY